MRIVRSCGNLLPAERHDLARWEAQLAAGQWLPREVSRDLITQVRLLLATITQQAAFLREVTQEREADNAKP